MMSGLLSYFVSDSMQVLFDVAVKQQVAQNCCMVIWNDRWKKWSPAYLDQYGARCPVGATMTEQGIAWMNVSGDNLVRFAWTELGRRMRREHPEHFEMLCMMQEAHEDADTRVEFRNNLFVIVYKFGLSGEAIRNQMTEAWAAQAAPWIMRYDDGPRKSDQEAQAEAPGQGGAEGSSAGELP